MLFSTQSGTFKVRPSQAAPVDQLGGSPSYNVVPRRVSSRRHSSHRQQQGSPLLPHASHSLAFTGTLETPPAPSEILHVPQAVAWPERKREILPGFKVVIAGERQ